MFLLESYENGNRKVRLLENDNGIVCKYCVVTEHYGQTCRYFDSLDEAYDEYLDECKMIKED